VGHFRPASYGHFEPARVVYYVRRFHIKQDSRILLTIFGTDKRLIDSFLLFNGKTLVCPDFPQ
ncbi:hypothetical protein, partial [Flagellimonas baculiformis]|uniref:hypothetical protein n=1 Tax=Flagellimonas baculiformis TaxID=3067310 RepID=UPI00296FD731